MKQLIVTILLTVFGTLLTNAQGVIQPMYNLYRGHVETLTQHIEGLWGEISVKFDHDGRALEINQNGVKLELAWSDDKTSVNIKGYANGVFQGEQPMTVKENSDTKFEYEMAGVTYTVIFQSNGSISKQTMTNGAQKMTNFYYYRSSDDLYPFKIVTNMQGQSMTAEINILETDKYGNATRFSQTMNGQTQTTINEITYYPN